MDYLGWELERQRAALAALLSGGGEARDGEKTVREGERRSPEGPETALGSAGEPAGRYAGGRSGDTGGPGYAGGPGDGAPGAWEAVRMAGTDRLPERTAKPVSAWEEITGVYGGSEQAGREEAGALTASGQAFRQRERRPLSGGTGAQRELSRPSGGYGAGSREAETAAWETEPWEAEPREKAAGDTAETTAEAAGTAGKRRAGEYPVRRPPGAGEIAGTAAPETGAGGLETAGDGGVRTLGTLTDADEFTRQWSGLRRRGGESGPAVRSRSAGAGEAAATPWGGAGETAALREEDGARALSRAVQRDARRYDGGFCIY